MDTPEIIYVRGGDKKAPIVARLGGMLYGVRHDYTPYDSVYMLDIKWDDYSWPDVASKVKRYQPPLSMVPDFFNLEQLPELLDQIAQLKSLGVKRVMVCPKFHGAIQYIPLDCVVAISVYTSYAGFQPEPEETAGRTLHLLGGHPDQQLFLMSVYNRYGRVISVDGNELGFKAMKGQFWNCQRGTWTTPETKTPTIELAIQSGLNIRKYFEAGPMVFRSKRVTRSMYTNTLF